MNFRSVLRFQFLVLSLFLFCDAVQADWTKYASTDFKIAQPPTAGSVEAEEDYRMLFELQESRTPEQCALGNHQQQPEFQVLFDQSGLLTKEQLHRFHPLLSKVGKLTERISGYFKSKFKRPRPYDVDTRLKPCVPLPGGSRSYPSSHASVSWAMACVLAQLLPAQAQELKTYGAFLGELRVTVGVHHPSDVAAGQQIGQQVCTRLMNDPEFLAELGSVVELPQIIEPEAASAIQP